MVMIFKRILEASGALEAVVRVFPPHGAGAYLLLFAAPFLHRPPDRRQPGLRGHRLPAPPADRRASESPDLVLILFAYVSGFCGILLSPAHLCLALTADYFKAELRDVYRILILPGRRHLRGRRRSAGLARLQGPLMRG